MSSKYCEVPNETSLKAFSLFLFINLCFIYIFSYFGPGLGSLMLLGTIAVSNIIIHGKIEAYHDNNVQVESKWHERLLSLLNSFYSMSTVLACYLFWAYDSTLLIFFGSCFLYLYVGIIVPSTAILKNPLMKSYIRGRFPEIPELVVVIDWKRYVYSIHTNKNNVF